MKKAFVRQKWERELSVLKKRLDNIEIDVKNNFEETLRDRHILEVKIDIYKKKIMNLDRGKPSHGGEIPDL